MWGVLIAGIIYGVAIVLNIGREGLQEYHSNSKWTDEEIEQVKAASVFGWKMFIAVSIIMGMLLLGFAISQKVPEREKLIEDVGLVTKISESDNGDVIFWLDDEKEILKIKHRLCDQLDLGGLKKACEQKTGVIVLSDEKGKLQKDAGRNVYDITTSKNGTLLSYETVMREEGRKTNLWIQIACAIFTIGAASIGVLMYAKHNPEAYKIICLMKGEKGIRPTVSQKVEQYIDNILTSEEQTKGREISAGYYGKYREKMRNSDTKKQYK